MSLFEGWFFVSKDEQRRRRNDMSELIFQFGEDKQRPVVSDILNELYGNTRKFSGQDQLFGFISAKNQFLRAKKNDDAAAIVKARDQLKKNGWKDEERIKLMIAFIELDDLAGSLDEYPSADDIRRRAVISPI